MKLRANTEDEFSHLSRQNLSLLSQFLKQNFSNFYN